MQEESLLAQLENCRIHDEFNYREAQSKELVKKQQLSLEKLMRVRIERDVMKLSIEIQEKSIAALVSQNIEMEMYANSNLYNFV